MFKIGFVAKENENGELQEQMLQVTESNAEETIVPRKLVVEVHFPSRNANYSYYNDRFNLKKGDYVFVEGNHIYEVEFYYENGVIGQMTCGCYRISKCKHVFAAMLQLKETLEHISKRYDEEYDRSGDFAAAHNYTFYGMVLEGKEKGTVEV